MKQRDLEILSSYLDGQLKPSDSARLEARLSSDSDLRAVLDDLRAARGLLRHLPMRKAPRNFTLTPKMVGKNPPLPRSYPAFRFVTALASLLLFFTFGLNYVVPQVAQTPGFGFGGGGAPEISSAQEAPAVAPEAAATEASPDASVLMAPQPTPTIAAAADNAARQQENPSDKEGMTGNAPPQVAEPVPVQNQLPVPVPLIWQLVLAAIALAGVLAMLLMRQASASRWRRK